MRVDENRLTATYLLANRKHGALYLGSALGLIARVADHKEVQGSRHTARYNITLLGWDPPVMLVAEARDGGDGTGFES